MQDEGLSRKDKILIKVMSKKYDVANARKIVHWGRWLSWVIVSIIVIDFFWLCYENKNFGWSVVAHYFTKESILHGLYITLALTVISMLFGTLLGLIFAIGRLSTNRLLQYISNIYIWFFRSTPLLVQLIFWYNLSALFPYISIAVPFGPTLASWDTNDIITPLSAAIIGLALNEGAYMAEIIRGGLISVDPNQRETAIAFGMTRSQILFRVIIPQAMRSIIPPTGNQVISMVKATAMVSVIAMDDLLYSVQVIYNENFQIIPLLIVAVTWYLIVTSVLSIGQMAIERYYAKGDKGHLSGDRANG